MNLRSRIGLLASLVTTVLVVPAYGQRDLEMTIKFKNSNIAQIQFHIDQVQTEGSLTCSQPSDVVVSPNGSYLNRCVAAARDGRRNVEVKGSAKVVCPPNMRSAGACDFSFSLRVYAGSHKFGSTASRLTDTWNCPASGRCLVEIDLRPDCWQGCYFPHPIPNPHHPH